ncbi:hypothetical protein A9D60_19870 [Leisingera sp. JC1]|nr:hypothetical protein A9D60_19870 [Leisingera sp. JC1]
MVGSNFLRISLKKIWVLSYYSAPYRNRPLVGQGMARVDAIREVRITEQTYYRWRKQYGGMGKRPATGH